METRFYLEGTDIRVVEYDDGFVSLQNTSGLMERDEPEDRILLDETELKVLRDYLNKKFSDNS